MISSTEFRRLVNELRATFFPAWDRASVWKFYLVAWNHVTIEPAGNMASCYPAGTTICFNDRLLLCGLPLIEAVVIHEITHAVLPEETEDHGPMWQAELMAVALKARALGRECLVRHLKLDLEGRREGKTTESFSECVHMLMEHHKSSAPLIPLSELIERVARRLGVPAAYLRMKCPCILIWG